MIDIDPFAPAQIAGYGALILGVTAVLQKNDTRLKGFICAQAAIYCLHFFMLGNLGGAASTGITFFRSGVALMTRKAWIAHGFALIYLAFGYRYAEGYAGWLPICANIIGTYAFFYLQGIAMRVLILSANFMMLTTGILSGSIGGTILESIIITANVSTIIRLVREQQKAMTVILATAAEDENATATAQETPEER